MDVGLEKDHRRREGVISEEGRRVETNRGKMSHDDELVGKIEIRRQAEIQTGGTRRVPSKTGRRKDVHQAPRPSRKGEREKWELTEAGPTEARKRAASRSAGRVARRLENSLSYTGEPIDGKQSNQA